MTCCVDTANRFLVARSDSANHGRRAAAISRTIETDHTDWVIFVPLFPELGPSQERGGHLSAAGPVPSQRPSARGVVVNDPSRQRPLP